MFAFTDILLLLLIPLLLAASAFFSGSETALFSLSAHERATLARQNSLFAHTLTTLLAETRGLLITLLLGNMTINVVYFVLSTVLLLRIQRTASPGPVLMTALSLLPLLGVILLGEVLPKLLASRMTMRWAKLFGIPLWLVHRTIAPVRIALQVAVITPLARLIAPANKPPELSTEELGTLLELSQQHGVIDRSEEQLLQQVLTLSQMKVRDLMVPRVDVKAHDLEDEPGQLLELMRSTGLSHLPAYRGSLDHVQGVLYSRQVLLHPPRTRAQVQALVRQARFVPEQQRGDALLVEMRKMGTTFAVVVDEYGGTAGIVTLEDVVEHMVGDIVGPYETGEPEVVILEPGRWRVSGDLSIHDWTDAFGQPDLAAGVSTVAGLVMARLGRLPRPGDRISVGNVQFEVERMTGPRVQTLIVQRLTPAERMSAGPSTAAAPHGRGGPA